MYYDFIWAFSNYILLNLVMFKFSNFTSMVSAEKKVKSYNCRSNFGFYIVYTLFLRLRFNVIYFTRSS